jgi:hypothetical protein
MTKASVLLACILMVACGGSVTTPTDVPDTGTVVPTVAPIPPYFEGFYVLGSDLEREHVPGNLHIAILSWGDDMERIGRNLAASGQRVLVSMHCCFEEWSRVEETWVKPLMEARVFAGVYVCDECGMNGISDADVARVAAQIPYPTFATRVWGNFRAGRLPVDYYSIVMHSYDRKKEWARDYHRTGDTDWVVGQAYVSPVGYEKGMPDQQYWRETAHETGKGIISWVWRWPGQTGCADVPECVEVWR